MENTERTSIAEFKKSHMIGTAEVKKETYAWFIQETEISSDRRMEIQNFVKGILAALETTGKELIIKCPISKLMEAYISEAAWDYTLRQFLRENISSRLKKTEITNSEYSNCKLAEWTKTDIQSFIISNQDMILSDICTSNLLFRPILINLRIQLLALDEMSNQGAVKSRHSSGYKEEIDGLIKLLENGNFDSISISKKLSGICDRIGLAVALKRYQFLTKEKNKELYTRLLSTVSEVLFKVTSTVRFLKEEQVKVHFQPRFITFMEQTPRLILIPPSEIFRYAHSSSIRILGRQFEQFSLMPNTILFDENGLIFRDRLPNSKLEFIELLLKAMGVQPAAESLRTYEALCNNHDESKLKIFLLENPEFQKLPLVSFSSFHIAGVTMKTIFPGKQKIEIDRQKSIEVTISQDETFKQPIYIGKDGSITHLKRFIFRNDVMEFAAPRDTHSPGPTIDIALDSTPHYYQRADLSKNTNSVELSMTTASKRGSLSRSNSTGNIPAREPISDDSLLKTESAMHMSEMNAEWDSWFKKEYDFSKNPEGVYASFVVSYTLVPMSSDSNSEFMQVQGKITITKIQISPTAPYEVIKHFFNSLENIEGSKEKLEIINKINIGFITPGNPLIK